MKYEFPVAQAGFRKVRGTRDQIANIRWIIEKAREFQKHIYFCLLTMPKPLTVWITTNCGNFWKRWEYWPPDLPLEKSVCRLGSNSLNWTWSNRLVLNRKGSIKAIYCHPAYLTYMLSTSWEMLGWMKHKLESRLLGEISITSDMQMTPTLWQKANKN